VSVQVVVHQSDATNNNGSWVLSSGTDAAALLTTVTQPASESSYCRSGGTGSGILKLSIPAGNALYQRINYVRLAPILLSGLSSANNPTLLAQLIVGGTLIDYRRFDVDTAGDFMLVEFEFGPLNMLGSRWRANPAADGRQVWYSVIANPSNIHDAPVPIFG
jgi:hypothetical protein